jgi:hypothetical protein
MGISMLEIYISIGRQRFYGHTEQEVLALLQEEEQLYGAQHIQMYPRLLELAKIYDAQDNVEKAEQVYSRIMVIQENFRRHDRCIKVAEGIYGLRALYSRQERHGDLERLQQQLVAAKRAYMASGIYIEPTEPETNDIQSIKEAMEHYRRLLPIAESQCGDCSVPVVRLIERLMELSSKLGDFYAARMYCQRLIEIQQLREGPSSYRVRRLQRKMSLISQERKGLA